jgi:hypothetical protein
VRKVRPNRSPITRRLHASSVCRRGAGKTFTMAATGMKMKQAGLIKKPM